MSDANTTPADVAAPAPEVNDGFRVFVGNIPFNATQASLTQTFAPAGNVVAVDIIKRYTRSLGYGFITFESEEEAAKAVQIFDKFELEGRSLNVERVRPRDPNAPPPARTNRRNRRKSGNSNGDAAAAGEEGAEGTSKPRRQRRQRTPRTEGGEEGGARIDDADAPAEGEVGSSKPRGRRNNRRRGPRHDTTAADEVEGAAPAVENGESANEGGNNNNNNNNNNRRRGRGRRNNSKKERDPNAELSKTLLFVANLPFKVDDEQLKGLFQNYNIVSAKVITLRGGRSKGFGFLEVADEAEQQKILSEFPHPEIEGRQLVVRVAHATSEGNKDAAAPGEEGEAAEATTEA